MNDTYDDYDMHFATCETCRMFRPCTVALGILDKIAQATAARIAPIPKEAAKA